MSKTQHRHRQLVWRAFTPLASLGGAFQRQCNAVRIFAFEHGRLEIERVAMLCNFG
jgi:hypothetical protein